MAADHERIDPVLLLSGMRFGVPMSPFLATLMRSVLADGIIERTVRDAEAKGVRVSPDAVYDALDRFIAVRERGEVIVDANVLLILHMGMQHVLRSAVVLLDGETPADAEPTSAEETALAFCGGHRPRCDLLLAWLHRAGEAIRELMDATVSPRHFRRFMSQRSSYRHPQPKERRNDPCQCGSGKKHKKCCARSRIDATPSQLVRLGPDDIAAGPDLRQNSRGAAEAPTEVVE